LVFCIVSRCLRRLWRAFYGGGGFKCFFRGADLFGAAAAEAVQWKSAINLNPAGGAPALLNGILLSAVKY
jgi:hypothetical protein